MPENVKPTIPTHLFRANPIALLYLRLCLLFPLIQCAEVHWSALAAQYLVAIPLCWIAPRLSLPGGVLTLLGLPILLSLAWLFILLGIQAATGGTGAIVPWFPFLIAAWSAGHVGIFLVGLTVVIPIESARRGRKHLL